MIKKHIKRRYKIQLPMDKITITEGARVVKPGETSSKDAKAADHAYIVTENDEAVFCLIHKEKQRDYILPVPDLTLIYFSSAQKSYNDYILHKAELLEKTDLASLSTSEGSMNEFYKFYISATSTIIFLSTALESFVNSMIMREATYRKPSGGNRKGVIEEYDHEGIQRHLSTECKMEDVLPKLHNKNFFKIQNKDTAAIVNLKRCRDSIIHTKIKKEEHLQDTVIKLLMKHDYNASIQACANFMNFFSPGYIVECNCGSEF